MRKIQISKPLKRTIFLLILVGLGIPTGIIIKKVSSASSQGIKELFTPHIITYNITSIFDVSLRTNIQKFVEAHTHQQNLIAFDRTKFYKDLKHHFPIIKSVEYELRPPETLHCTIIGTTPLCRINNTLILGNKRRLFPCSLFNEINQELLPNITINSRLLGEKVSPQLFKFIHSIDKDYWKRYQISYYAAWNINLIPNTSLCHCRIITDEQNFFNQQKFDALGSLFTDLCNRKLISSHMMNSKGIPLTFDFRIKNQVIVKFHESSKRGKGS
jgi:hypothetical protein